MQSAGFEPEVDIKYFSALTMLNKHLKKSEFELSVD